MSTFKMLMDDPKLVRDDPPAMPDLKAMTSVAELFEVLLTGANIKPGVAEYKLDLGSLELEIISDTSAHNETMRDARDRYAKDVLTRFATQKMYGRIIDELEWIERLLSMVITDRSPREAIRALGRLQIMIRDLKG